MLYLKLEASARLLGILGLGSKLYPGNMQRVLTERSYSIHAVFLENTKIEQAKERLCWQGDNNHNHDHNGDDGLLSS